MLLRLIAKNFLSFDEEVHFDMFPNKNHQTLPGHIQEVAGISVLKQALIFGSNGAGKSNLIEAVKFITRIAIDKDFYRSVIFENKFYKLKYEQTEPMILAIEFIHENHVFYYEISIDRDLLIKEALYETFPQRASRDLIYKRDNTKVELAKQPSPEISNAIIDLLSKNPHSSLLSANREFPIVADPRCAIATKWLANFVFIIEINSQIKLIELFQQHQEIFDFSKRLLSQLDLGISDINLKEYELEAWAKQQHISLSNKNQYVTGSNDWLSLFPPMKMPISSVAIEVDEKEKVQKVHQIVLSNIGKNGFIGELDVNMQSDGTLRLLMLIPSLYFASKLGCTVLIDEVNFCLSSNVLQGIIEYFAKTTGTNGQFICTTHDTLLLKNQSILRPDEVWFVEKNNGSSDLYSLNDFKEIPDLSPFEGYTEGRYGAISFVNLLNNNDY